MDKICTDKSQSKHNTFIVSKILPAHYAHYVFQPMQGTLLRWDNTKMRTKEDTVETKETSSLQVWKTFAISENLQCVLEW